MLPQLQPAGVATAHTSDSYYEIRTDIVRRDVPRSMALVGVAVVTITLVSLWLTPTTLSDHHVAQVLLGLLFLVMAWITSRRYLLATTIMWLWSLLTVLAVALATAEAIRDNNTMPLGYALIFMVASAPIAMHWKPALTAAAGQLALFAYASSVVSQSPARQTLVGVFAAFAAMGLLSLRMSSIAAIAGQWEATQKMTNTDPLTGLPTRQGLLDMLGPFVAHASQQNLQLTLTVVDVRNLGELNVAHGSNYGDEVMRATAHALSATIDRSFLLARWPGARFVMVDAGVAPEEAALQGRLARALQADPVTQGRTTPAIAVASAEGEADLEQFDALHLAAVKRIEAPRLTFTEIVR